MNYGLLHALAKPRGRALVVLAATATIAAALPARAQQPAPAPAAPKAAPKAAAPKAAAPKQPAQQPAPTQQTQAPPPQPQQQGQADQIQLIYSPWTKFCLKPQDSNTKQVCFTGKDGRIESGQAVIAAVIIEPEGEPKKLLRVTLPLGMLLNPGTRVIVDSNQPAQSPYIICLQNGCMADYEVTPDLIANMKKGQTLYVQAISGNNQPLTLPLPLSDFAKAYDGPPTDPKEFERQQKELQDQLQKRAKELEMQRQQQQGGAGGTSPAAPSK